MNSATNYYPEDFVSRPEHRGRLTAILVFIVCYGAILGALMASAYLLG